MQSTENLQSDSTTELGISNAAFENDAGANCQSRDSTPPPPYLENTDNQTKKVVATEEVADEGPARDTWGNPIEFLMSCISMSVGLGNVWRFPFTAYENGGGAFLIPYLIVLLLIGKPLYFLEMVLGQFSNYGSVKVWKVVPIVKGVGYGQAIATWSVVTYYCCLMALTVFYFFSSFQQVLPWTVCDPEWASESCYPSGNSTGLNTTGLTSSTEEYFLSNVLKKLDHIDDGVGIPDWRLALCLLFSWICICLILIKGVASSGKVAYFTAIFPYVVLITLLIRGVTLEGAGEGILFFIKPRWEQLFTAKVWYAAVTQCFFSLSVGFGPIITFSSYNPFQHKIYRDSIIISFMDTFTSVLAGVTIFAILGNLASESGKDISEVVAGGAGLAFISYPEALAKFNIVPQLFSVLFFLMMFTLGVGSAVSLTSCIITIICDAFPTWKRWIVTVVVSISGFLIGLVYVTPGGQYILDLVDYFGGGFVIYVMAIIETVAICWIYGLKNFMKDIEFMLGIKLGFYWVFTWGFFIPVALLTIFIYSLITYEPLKVGNYALPTVAIVSGWLVAAFALIQVPAWGIHVVYKQKHGVTLLERIKRSFVASEEWGPKDQKHRSAWILFKQEPLGHSWHTRVYNRVQKALGRRSVDVAKNPDLHFCNSQASIVTIKQEMF